MERMIVILLGVLLDILIGDPKGLWHPVMGIGSLIGWLEKILCKIFSLDLSKPLKNRSGDKRKEIAVGGILSIVTIALSAFLPALILFFAGWIHPYLKLFLSVVMCGQILAARSLYEESRKVYVALTKKELSDARYAVSMIVGRDTKELSKEGVTKACVETVAENASDGVLAPLFYLLLGGPVLGFFYKAINTMDSMIGYRNNRYENFGKIAAKLDDVINYLPARISAILFLIASCLCGYDWRGAIRIWKRDRRKQKSPNAGQTESVCAGALGIELAGDASYFGVVCHKELIGDRTRDIEPEDILRANRLMFASEGLMVLLAFLFFSLLYQL
ncbi:MAG: adenosylcobinamide-phosphate synthase CbiB [Clostridiales bacterium]|nr:adenosylcobinamide-phosphate synthase CbiB [Clostridiales bacterium]